MAKAPKIPKAPKAPKPAKIKAPKAKAPSKRAPVEPMKTGDVSTFPSHVYRADQGEHIPAQTGGLNPNRAK